MASSNADDAAAAMNGQEEEEEEISEEEGEDNDALIVILGSRKLNNDFGNLVRRRELLMLIHQQGRQSLDQAYVARAPEIVNAFFGLLGMEAQMPTNRRNTHWVANVIGERLLLLGIDLTGSPVDANCSSPLERTSSRGTSNPCM